MKNKEVEFSDLERGLVIYEVKDLLTAARKHKKLYEDYFDRAVNLMDAAIKEMKEKQERGEL